MRFVELKSEAQLDMQTLHRARDRLVEERTALINQLRAVLLERGITVAQGRRELERHLAGLDAQVGPSQRMRVLVEDMRTQWSELDRRIAQLDKEFVKWTRKEEAARRLITIPGIGVLNATALIAAIGRAESFARGRDLAAWLGLGRPPIEQTPAMTMESTIRRKWRPRQGMMPRRNLLWRRPVVSILN
jgi:transposase